MTPLRIVLLAVVAFVFGCGLGAALLALWAYWETGGGKHQKRTSLI